MRFSRLHNTHLFRMRMRMRMTKLELDKLNLTLLLNPGLMFCGFFCFVIF